jgi:hypothetical protein
MHGGINLAMRTPEFMPRLPAIKGDNDGAIQEEFCTGEGSGLQTALRQRLAVSWAI